MLCEGGYGEVPAGGEQSTSQLRKTQINPDKLVSARRNAAENLPRALSRIRPKKLVGSITRAVFATTRECVFFIEMQSLAVPAGHLRQHEDGGEHGIRRQGACL